MLVLSRKAGESVVIGQDVRVTVLRSAGGRVRLGIEAPRGIKILREEILDAIEPPGGSQTDAA